MLFVVKNGKKSHSCEANDDEEDLDETMVRADLGHEDLEEGHIDEGASGHGREDTFSYVDGGRVALVGGGDGSADGDPQTRHEGEQDDEEDSAALVADVFRELDT